MIWILYGSPNIQTINFTKINNGIEEVKKAWRSSAEINNGIEGVKDERGRDNQWKFPNWKNPRISKFSRGFALIPYEKTDLVKNWFSQIHWLSKMPIYTSSIKISKCSVTNLTNSHTCKQ